jgi:hypothetical protein
VTVGALPFGGGSLARVGARASFALGILTACGAAPSETVEPTLPAYELTSRWMLGELGRPWTVLYVIQTPNGYGLLQASGAGDPPEMPPRDLRLMRELVEFGG